MKVTEYNVGQWCLSEDECIAQGINFGAYERGVADAASAFAKSDDEAGWLFEQRLITYEQLEQARKAVRGVANGSPAQSNERNEGGQHG